VKGYRGVAAEPGTGSRMDGCRAQVLGPAWFRLAGGGAVGHTV